MLRVGEEGGTVNKQLMKKSETKPKEKLEKQRKKKRKNLKEYVKISTKKIMTNSYQMLNNSAQEIL